MTEAEKDKIIESILAEVHSSGSARVGYHAEQFLQQRPIPYNVKSKIDRSIYALKRYESRPHPNFKNDYEIFINPNFELSESVRKTNKTQRIVLWLTALISAVTLIVAYLDYKKDNAPKIYLIPQGGEKQILKPQKSSQLPLQTIPDTLIPIKKVAPTPDTAK